jgi:uncharacterized protein (DUF433 family)
MSKGQVVQRNGGFWIKGTRISLDSIIISFQQGASPETIKHRFPVLTLEEVYGAITYYLANEKTLNEYLAESNQRFEAETELRREELRRTKPDLMKRLEEARQGSTVTR